jgi:hypothetical protein
MTRWPDAATRTCAAALLTAVAFAVTPPAANADIQKVRGEIGFGYAKLFLADAPGGSMSTAAGLSYPVSPNWSVGPSIAFNLLGSRTVERGSLIASVDYSTFEAGLFAHWVPQGLGPIALVSFGPEVMNARAELSTTGGGAAFSDLAVHEVVPAAALDVTVMQHRERPVRIGLELGGRYAFMPAGRQLVSGGGANKGDDWVLLSTRLVFHY